MQATSALDLDRTRAAFETWRASQPRRRRIPDHLWQQALSLLDHHPISRVAHTLRLDPKQLRQRQLSAARLLTPDAAKGPNFIEMPAARLDIGTSTPKTKFNSPYPTTEIDVKLIFERCDGSRLMLCLPASNWDRIMALCTNFIHH